MAMNKRKKTTAIVAGVTAAALLLGGTFAWTSISQQAKNEAIVDINPGGRLHDDFDGTNKDVYVENFSSGATGVNIFARIRLDQYFEVGQDAGINKEESARKVTKPLGDDTDINDVTTWKTYEPVVDEEGNIDLSNPIQANDNWQWTLGNEDDNLPYYMPTFNKNKDSLAADINGTYEGTVEGDIVHYDDFVKYGSADEATTDASIVSSITGNATYDWDEDTEDEINPTEITDRNLPIDSADVLKEEETHEATQISTTATVISMAEWIALYNDGIENNETGNFWVYDTDGWAYWAQAIEPGKTTGLLLDGINMSRVPDDNWYYGINVVGQFATASDWEMFFAPEDEGGAGETAMTEDAKQLMALITATTPADDDENTDDGILILDADNSDTVYQYINTEIPVDFDTTGLDADANQPDISDIIVTRPTYNEAGEYIEGGDETLNKDTDYTYTYDLDTEQGTLTITNSTLEGETLRVTDKNGVVKGDVYVEYESGTGSGDGDQPLIEVDAVDAGSVLNFGTGAEFTVSCADTIEGATVENAQLGILDGQPEGVEVTDNQDGTFAVKVNEVTEAGFFAFTASATLGGETINDSLQINLNPDLKAYGVNIYLPEGYAGGISPGAGGTFTASSDNLTWSISGSTDEWSEDNTTGTTIDAEHGVVLLSLKEEAEYLIIKAVDKDDPTKGGEYKLKVIVDIILSINVESTGENTATLTAVDARYYVTGDTYDWSVNGNATVEGGVFNATEAGEYTVTATSNTNSKITASIVLTVDTEGNVTYPTTAE